MYIHACIHPCILHEFVYPDYMLSSELVCIPLSVETYALTDSPIATRTGCPKSSAVSGLYGRLSINVQCYSWAHFSPHACRYMATSLQRLLDVIQDVISYLRDEFELNHLYKPIYLCQNSEPSMRRNCFRRIPWARHIWSTESHSPLLISAFMSLVKGIKITFTASVGRYSNR